jgi:ATP-dependent helicase/nuclease subunit A
LANLDAFLELALNQDGGRYPSLSRFIGEINAIRQGDDDETPDEGDVDIAVEENLIDINSDSEMSEEDRHKRVRMMTIHGAKGLESPFVILLDANNTATNVDYGGILMNWSPLESSPSHLSLFVAKTLTSPRSEIYEAEKAIGDKENWNLLYVAMTRAKQGLWISGDARKPTKNSPHGVDESSWYGKAEQVGLPVFNLPELATQSTQGKDERVIAHALAQPKGFKVEDFVIDWDLAKEHQIKRQQEIEGGLSLQVFEGEDLIQDPAPDSGIMEEGVHFHKLMEYLSSQTGAPMESNISMSMQDVANWFNVDEAQAKKALDRALKVINTEALKKYLTAGVWVQAWNEIDIVNGQGKTLRLDRLVEFDDHLAIIDYKLTIPDQASEQYVKYRSQLNNYKQELGRIRQDKPIKAYLISSEGQIECLA